MQRDKESEELKTQEEIAGIREELDIAKEKIMMMQKNEAVIEVYKKKIENMAQLQ